MWKKRKGKVKMETTSRSSWRYLNEDSSIKSIIRFSIVIKKYCFRE